MILLPIGRDDAVVQRHAWISYAIIALNVVIWLATTMMERPGALEPAQERWEATMRYYAAHPYLHVPDSVANLVPSRLKRAASGAGSAPPGVNVAAEQRTLDELAAELHDAYHAIPRIRFAYIPAEGSALTIFTSMFLHTGFMHLLGNMLFFFATGPFIEDVFGRPLFFFLYFSGGAAATLWYASKHAGSTIPLMGASGAIAAIMGAYLVRFLRSKLEFIFIPFLWRPMWNYRFYMPAFVVLPLWFAEQFFFSATVESSGGGVAFSAHVGGFVYGMAVALIVKLTGFEEKFVAPVVEKQTSWKADDRLVRAMDAQAKGDAATARREVGSLLAQSPNDVDALRFAVDAWRDAGDDRRLDGYATRLLNRYAEEKQSDAAWELIHDLRGDLPHFYARAAQFAERNGDRDTAIVLYERLCTVENAGPNAIGSLVKLGALRKAKGDLAGARDALAQARAHPQCSAEWAESIDAKMAALR